MLFLLSNFKCSTIADLLVHHVSANLEYNAVITVYKSTTVPMCSILKEISTIIYNGVASGVCFEYMSVNRLLLNGIALQTTPAVVSLSNVHQTFAQLDFDAVYFFSKIFTRCLRFEPLKINVSNLKLFSELRANYFSFKDLIVPVETAFWSMYRCTEPNIFPL